MISKRHY